DDTRRRAGDVSRRGEPREQVRGADIEGDRRADYPTGDEPEHDLEHGFAPEAGSLRAHLRSRKYQSTTARPTPTMKTHSRTLRRLIGMSDSPQNGHRRASAG